MWSEIIGEFSDSPSQTRVVKFLLENGFGVNKDGRITCNEIEIPATQVAKSLGTDRRVVDTTAQRILSLPLHRDIFTHMRAAPDLSRVAEHLDLSVMTILPKDASEKRNCERCSESDCGSWGYHTPDLRDRSATF